MLHKKRVLTTVYYAMRRRLRQALRIAPRHTAAPILGYSLEVAIERHAWIARAVLQHSPPELDLSGKAVCEVGAGDCLAAVSLFLAKGARQVNIVEVERPVWTEKQWRVLEGLRAQELPVDLTVLQGGETPQLDASRVQYHQCFMENFRGQGPHEFLFSFSVLEHVEDLDAFHRACAAAVAPGGWVLHLVDLGGHELFEDPLPPLDFQTYPDWLYGLMYPRYHRATRRFLRDHVEALAGAGFQIEKVTPTRVAEAGYLEPLWPRLRPGARARPRDEVAVVEFAVLARKPAG